MTQKPRGSHSDAVRLVARIRKAVDRGADAAESIHKRVAQLPLAPFEGVDGLEGALKDVRRVQDRSIGAVYDLVRGVSRELVRLTEELLAASEQPKPKRRATRPRARASAAPKAA